MTQGFIKLYRSFLDSPWYKDANTSRLLLHCLLKANWKTGNFQGVTIDPGSFVTSLPKLSEELEISVHQVRTALDHLKLTGEVSVKTTNQYRIITVCAYCSFQESGIQSGSQLSDTWQADGRQTATIEEPKNENNKTRKKESSFYNFSERKGTDYEGIQNRVILKNFSDPDENATNTG